MRVTRTDTVGRFDKFERTGAGALKVPVTVSRSGLLQYPDRVEFRSAEETFRQDSVDSLRAVPVTWGHPPGRLVTPENSRELQRGLVSDQTPETRVRVDGSEDEWIRTTLVVTDSELIEAMEAAVTAGQHVEVSAGYTVEFVEKPGIAPDGTRHDGLQTNIQYNHVAILALKGPARAGEHARVRLDQQEQYNMTLEEKLAEAVTARSEAEAKAKQAEQRADAAEEKAEKEAARADTAEDALKAEKSRNDSFDVDAAVAERLDVCKRASKLLDAKYDTKGKSNEQIRKDALEAALGADKLQGKSEAYLAARFDSLTDEDAPAQYHAPKETRSDSGNESTRLDSDEAFRKALAERK